MTVSVTTTRNEYLGDASTVAFAISFPFFSSSDLQVTLRVIATGVDTLQTLGVHYSVSGGDVGAGPATGTLTMVTAPAATENLIIERVTTRTQGLDLVPGSSLPAVSLESALDKAVMLDQEDAREHLKAIRKPAGDDDSVDMELPGSAARASMLLGFSASGEPQAVDPVTISPSTVVMTTIGQDIVTAANAAAVRTLLEIVRNISSQVPELRATTEATLPASGTSGAWHVSTDTGKIRRWNGASWDILGVLPAAYASLVAAGVDDQILLATDRRQLYVRKTNALVKIRHMSPRSLGGFQITRNGGNTSRIDITAGAARNTLATGAGNAADDLNLIGAALTKDISAAWSAGNNGGLRASGVALTASEWYHLFAVGKSDGTVDYAADTNISASNIFADAALGAGGGYNWARRIGSRKLTAASIFFATIQAGDLVLFTDPSLLTLDHTQTATDFSAGVSITLENAPPDYVSEAVLRVSEAALDADRPTMIQAGGQTSIAPSGTASPLATFRDNITARGNVQQIRILTDGADPPNVKYRVLTDNTSDLHMLCIGWVDNRGKDYD